jgi:hypothetical protein
VTGGVDVENYVFLTSALAERDTSVSSPRRLNPRERAQVPKG